MKSFITLGVFLFAYFNLQNAVALRETGCPPASDIQPCLCYNSPYTVLECKDVTNVEVLRNIFINSTRYTYNEVHLEFCSLTYLPNDMFDVVTVKNLYLKNVTLGRLFDSPPSNLHQLTRLHIENTQILRGLSWSLLKPMTGLKILQVYFTSVRVLGTNVNEVTHDLEQFSFYATNTTLLIRGVFQNFTKLNEIDISACNLRRLTRAMFPTPFNVRVLYFNDNKLWAIPDDLFTQMPNLHTVGLRKNQFSVISGSAFEHNAARITYLFLDDNPIKCDCLLVWIVTDKPEVLSGTCASPKNLNGKKLKDLTTNDFNC